MRTLDEQRLALIVGEVMELVITRRQASPAHAIAVFMHCAIGSAIATGVTRAQIHSFVDEGFDAMAAGQETAS